MAPEIFIISSSIEVESVTNVSDLVCKVKQNDVFQLESVQVLLLRFENREFDNRSGWPIVRDSWFDNCVGQTFIFWSKVHHLHWDWHSVDRLHYHIMFISEERDSRGEFVLNLMWFLRTHLSQDNPAYFKSWIISKAIVLIVALIFMMVFAVGLMTNPPEEFDTYSMQQVIFFEILIFLVFGKVFVFKIFYYWRKFVITVFYFYTFVVVRSYLAQLRGATSIV